MLWLYNLTTQLYGLIIRIFSLFNSKAALFIKGRTNLFKKMAEKIDPSRQHIWFHFASLGEFEQGRPVLEKIKEQHPEKSIIITFFSPSGFEVRKNYDLADGIFYLPLDTKKNARKLIAAINPEMAVFTKYEYWYHYFKTLNDRNIPLFIISGIFRPNQIFFKWYGFFNRKVLTFVDHFFVQNTESLQLLKTLHIENVSISGDTRFDRVSENALAPKRFDKVAAFCGTKPIFIAGSTWPADERILIALIDKKPDWKFIIAPHEIDQPHIDEIQRLIPHAIKYSGLSNQLTDASVLIIDNIGLLASLYQYGNLAYTGGGFGAGIHNTLEAAAFGMPIIFGPKYSKFQEAKDLIALGAARSISNDEQLLDAFEKLTENKNTGSIAKKYVTGKTGATGQIIKYLTPYF